ERLFGVIGADIETAKRIGANLLRAKRPQLRVHRGAGALGSADQIDLIALDQPSADERCVITLDVLRWKGFDPAQQTRMYADRRAHEVVVEKRGDPSGSRRPPNVLH